MPDGRQQEGTISDESTYPGRHRVERRRGHRDLRRPVLRQGRGVHVPAQPLRRGAQQADRGGQAPDGPQRKHGGGKRHAQPGPDERRRRPGTGRGEAAAQDQPLVVRQVCGYHHRLVAAAAHEGLLRAQRLRQAAPVQVWSYVPLHLGRSRVHAFLRDSRRDADLKAAVWVQGLGGGGPCLVRGGGHGPVGRNHAGGEVAPVHQALHVPPVHGMRHQAKPLHRRQSQQQHQGRAPGQAARHQAGHPRSTSAART